MTASKFAASIENNRFATVLYKYVSEHNPENIALMYLNTLTNKVILANCKNKKVEEIEPIRLSHMAKGVMRDMLQDFDSAVINPKAKCLANELNLIAQKAIH